jgi:carbon starvation protein
MPLAWLLAVTMTAGYQKILSSEPAIGFLAQANRLAAGVAAGSVPADKLAGVRAQIFNLRLDAAVTGIFMALVVLIVAEATRACLRAWRAAPPGDDVAVAAAGRLPA